MKYGEKILRTFRQHVPQTVLRKLWSGASPVLKLVSIYMPRVYGSIKTQRPFTSMVWSVCFRLP